MCTGAGLLAAYHASPNVSMADHLLAQPSWAGTLRAEDERALREDEARLQDLPDAQRAHRVDAAARSLRWRAMSRRSGGAHADPRHYKACLRRPCGLCVCPCNAPNNNTQYILQYRQAAQLNCLCSRHYFCKEARQ